MADNKNRRISSNVRVPLDIWQNVQQAVNRFKAGRPPEDQPSLNDAVVEALEQWLARGCKFDKMVPLDKTKNQATDLTPAEYAALRDSAEILQRLTGRRKRSA